MMSEKMFSCSQVPKWIIISAPLNTDIKRGLPSPRGTSLGLPAFPLCVFSLTLSLNDDKLLSCVPTVLTQCDSPGAEFFLDNPLTPCLLLGNVAFTPQKETPASFSDMFNKMG